MNRRIGILAGLAALLPLATEGKKHPKRRALSAASLCGCPLTFATYSADFTPGGEDVSVVAATSPVVVTLPSAAASAGVQVMIVRAPGPAAKLTINDDLGAYRLNTPGLFVCDGTAWYVVANF